MKTPILDLTGQKFGRLTAVHHKREDEVTYWWCRCDCGFEGWFRQGNLHSQKTTSCGCYRDDYMRGIWKLRMDKRTPKPVRHHGKLTNDLVSDILFLHKLYGFGSVMLAEYSGMSRSTVTRVLRTAA